MPCTWASGSRTTTTTYDLKDRPAAVTDPLGGVTAVGYDTLDRRTSIRDPRGNTASFEYNSEGIDLS